MSHQSRGRKDGRARLLGRRRKRTLLFESLEDRVVPTIYVGSTLDVHNYGLDVTPAQLESGRNGNSSVTLLDAITAADNVQGPTTIVLQSLTNYVLSVVDNAWYGPDGLPPITSQVVIQGNGATIERPSPDTTMGTDPAFRLIYVGVGGSLTLTDLTLSGGLAQGGAGGEGYSAGGGGGAGLGGAIFNEGTLTLDSVTIDENEAIGGKGGDSLGNPGTNDSGGGGGGLGGAGGQGGQLNENGVYVKGGGGGGGFLTDGGYGSPGGGTGGAFLGGEGGGSLSIDKFGEEFVLGGKSTIGGSGASGVFGGGGGGALLTDNATSAAGAGAGHAAGLAGGNGGGAPSAGGGAFGGGGGGGSSNISIYTNGGGGGVGGGGGGAGDDTGTYDGLHNYISQAGSGGFGGGGGGGGGRIYVESLGGDGGFGGGGGGFAGSAFDSNGDQIYGGGGSYFGGGQAAPGINSGGLGGGGGAGLGGAIFNQGGVVVISNSTLTANSALGGAAGTGYPNGQFGLPADGYPGAGMAGAIFNLNGKVTLVNDTVIGNTAPGPDSSFDDLPYVTASGGDVYNLAQGLDAGGSPYPATLTLTNNIIGVLYNAQTSAGPATVNAADPNIIETAKSPSPATLIGNPSSYTAVLGPLTANAGGPATLPITDSPIEYFLYKGVTTQQSTNGVNVPVVDERGYSRSPVPFLGASQPATLVAVSSPDSGAYTFGQTVDITVTYNEPVTVSGVATILVQTSTTTTAYATYLSGSGTDQITFAYAVAPHDNIARFDYTGFNPLQGSIVDSQGVPVSLAVPLHSTNADGLYIRGITLLPDYVYTVSGGGQSAEVGSPYPSPLVVTVTDPSVLDGNGQPTPVSGVLIFFQNLNLAGLNFDNFFGEAFTDAQGHAAVTGRANFYDGPIDVEALAFGYPVATFSGTNLAFPPTFTSDPNATFELGQAGSFTVTTSSIPLADYQETGTLPAGVTFVDNFNGTATLAGTPGQGTDGTYPIQITASTYTGHYNITTQDFVLTVGETATFLGPFSTTFHVGQAGFAMLIATGSPTPQLTEVGPLPQGVTFVDNGDGTATLAGSPGPFTSGDYPLTIVANSGIGAADFEPFDLTVDDLPIVTISGPSQYFAIAGDSVTYTIDFTDDYPVELDSLGERHPTRQSL